MAGWNEEEIRGLVERTCEEQGVPVTVTDPAVLASVSALASVERAVAS